MKQKSTAANKTDEIWEKIIFESIEIKKKEPLLNYFIDKKISDHNSFQECLSYLVADNLECSFIEFSEIKKITDFALDSDEKIIFSTVEDILANFDRDPACTRHINPVLYYKGFQALQCYRIANFYSKKGKLDLAYLIQMLVSNKFSVDIHPFATIGKGILMDHAHGIVIGETAKIGDNVSLLHSVTLGGTGKEEGDRHPKIHSGVSIYASSTILGNIIIGKNSTIAAGSLVLKNVEPNVTVAGIPAKIINK